ncbi:MAG: hypothetical protein GY870_21125 [archaeon]|nr:hypothetical protein [archaeon]
MGFFYSYIIISVMALLAHPLAKKYRPQHKGFVFYWSLLASIGIMIIDCCVYAGLFDTLIAGLSNLPWFDGSITTGADYMWNSFVIFGVPRYIETAGNLGGLNVIGILLILSYPTWFVYWKDLGRQIFGQKKYQGGYFWVLSPVKKPKNYKKK